MVSPACSPEADRRDRSCRLGNCQRLLKAQTARLELGKRDVHCHQFCQRGRILKVVWALPRYDTVGRCIDYDAGGACRRGRSRECRHQRDHESKPPLRKTDRQRLRIQHGDLQRQVDSLGPKIGVVSRPVSRPATRWFLRRWASRAQGRRTIHTPFWKSSTLV